MKGRNALLVCFQVCMLSSSSRPILLPTHPNKSRPQPHHQLRPRTMRLLLRALQPPLLPHLHTPLPRKLPKRRRRLHSHTIILPSHKNTLPFLRHRQITLASLPPRRITSTASPMSALNLHSRLPLVSLLESFDLFTRGFLFLGLLFLPELPARFLDCL